MRSASVAHVPASVAPAARRASTSASRSPRGTSTSRHGLASPARRIGGCVGGSAGADVRPRVHPRDGAPSRGGTADGLANRRPVCGGVGHLDAKHEAHAVEVCGEARGGLGDEPRGLAVVDGRRHVLDAALGAQDHEFGRHARRERRDLLRAERVEPREAVGTRHGDDAEVRLVDDGAARLERPLLRRRVAVVPRDPRRRAPRRGRRRCGPGGGKPCEAVRS